MGNLVFPLFISPKISLVYFPPSYRFLYHDTKYVPLLSDGSVYRYGEQKQVFS
jgi:hypothetical protein